MTKLPLGINIKKLIDDLRTLSWEASDTLLYYSQILKDSNNKINILKNDNYDDPVTMADLKVNELIIKNLNEKYSNINWGILSEENVKSVPQHFEKNHEWVWVLDPLDGTKDFIQGTTNYAMHLALNYKGRPYLGIVLIPEREELWIADGENFWGEKRNGIRISSKLNKKDNINEMVLVTSKNHKNDTLKRFIEKIKFNKVITMGSIGCKVASIVRGESDIYISLSLPGESSPKDWDFASPEIILRASGGAITDIDNQELDYGKSNFEHSGIIVASSNFQTHKKLCLVLKEIIDKNEIYPF